MDDEVGLDRANQLQNPWAVPQIQVAMGEVPCDRPEPREIPRGIAIVAEEAAAHVVVDTMHLPAALVEERDRF
jgi:hypothetical protein